MKNNFFSGAIACCGDGEMQVASAKVPVARANGALAP
jgi:hypothetical protein